jgi:hypothetical protein
VFGKLEEEKKEEKKHNLPSYLIGPKAVGRPALPRLPAWAVQRRRGPASTAAAASMLQPSGDAAAQLGAVAQFVTEPADASGSAFPLSLSRWQVGPGCQMLLQPQS